FALTFQNHTDCPLTDFGGKTSIFSHPVYLFLRKFSLQDSRGGSVSVNQALTDKFLSLPSELRKSLTWDRGMELARHLEFTVSTGVKVYFCDPQSPWQRGTNENTNGLIRQYFPKKTCLAQYTQHELDLVAAQLNNRPRKTLKFKTPKEIIERGVALTD
ncbi:IS30 family transposase, partial [Escherichia coli]|uniref:IS30 family transposase n=3 Tax=Escherichia coli TaxID=562 RepID=UPI0039EF656C